jgi:hypothetical protein
MYSTDCQLYRLSDVQTVSCTDCQLYRLSAVQTVSCTDCQLFPPPCPSLASTHALSSELH